MHCLQDGMEDDVFIRRTIKTTYKFNSFLALKLFEIWVLHATVSILCLTKKMVSIDAKLNEFEPLKATLSDQKIRGIQALRPYG